VNPSMEALREHPCSRQSWERLPPTKSPPDRWRGFMNNASSRVGVVEARAATLWRTPRRLDRPGAASIRAANSMPSMATRRTIANDRSWVCDFARRAPTFHQVSPRRLPRVMNARQPVTRGLGWGEGLPGLSQTGMFAQSPHGWVYGVPGKPSPQPRPRPPPASPFMNRGKLISRSEPSDERQPRGRSTATTRARRRRNVTPLTCRPVLACHNERR